MHTPTNPGLARPIVRRYSVELIPVTLRADGTLFDEDPTEPIMVTLSYGEARADQLDPNSQEAHNEAFARAVKIERRNFQVPAERSFRAGTTRFTGAGVSKPRTTEIAA